MTADLPGNAVAGTSSSGVGVPRRVLVAGGVWAVPAVIVATAAPAVAASPGRCGYTFALVSGCRTDFAYLLQVSATRSCSSDDLSVVATYTANGAAGTGVILFEFPAGTATLVKPLRVFTSTPVSSLTISFPDTQPTVLQLTQPYQGSCG